MSILPAARDVLSRLVDRHGAPVVATELATPPTPGRWVWAAYNNGDRHPVSRGVVGANDQVMLFVQANQVRYGTLRLTDEISGEVVDFRDGTAIQVRAPQPMPAQTSGQRHTPVVPNRAGLDAALANTLPADAPDDVYQPASDGRYLDWSTVRNEGVRCLEVGDEDGRVISMGLTPHEIRQLAAMLAVTLVRNSAGEPFDAADQRSLLLATIADVGPHGEVGFPDEDNIEDTGRRFYLSGDRRGYVLEADTDDGEVAVRLTADEVAQLHAQLARTAMRDRPQPVTDVVAGWKPIPPSLLDAVPELQCPRCGSTEVGEEEDGDHFRCQTCTAPLRYATPSPASCPTCRLDFASAGWPLTHLQPDTRQVCGFIWATQTSLTER